MDLLYAVILAVVLTGLICLIETQRLSNASLGACLSLPFLFYSAIYIVGNTFSTLLAAPLLADRLPASLAAWFPFFFAFAGVFAFQGIVGNTNITVFGKGVLTIEEWISRARDVAAAAAVKAQLTRDDRSALRIANQLRQLPEDELNTYVSQFLGADIVPKLDAAAQQSHADSALYKALALAYEEPGKTSSLARELRKH